MKIIRNKVHIELTTYEKDIFDNILNIVNNIEEDFDKEITEEEKREDRFLPFFGLTENITQSIQHFLNYMNEDY